MKVTRHTPRATKSPGRKSVKASLVGLGRAEISCRPSMRGSDRPCADSVHFSINSLPSPFNLTTLALSLSSSAFRSSTFLHNRLTLEFLLSSGWFGSPEGVDFNILPTNQPRGQQISGTEHISLALNEININMRLASVTAFHLCRPKEWCDRRLCDGLSPSSCKGNVWRVPRMVSNFRPPVAFPQPPSWKQAAPSTLAPREDLSSLSTSVPRSVVPHMRC